MGITSFDAKLGLMSNVYIVEVTPVIRSPFSRKLTFFSLDNNLRPGQIVFCEIRTKKVAAVVNSIRPLDSRSNVKRLPFEIRNLGRQKSRMFLGSDFAQERAVLARKLAVTESELQSAILPSNLDRIQKELTEEIDLFREKHKARRAEILNIEGSFHNRAKYYIDSVWAKLGSRSLLVVVPNSLHGGILARELLRLGVPKVVGLDDAMSAKSLGLKLNDLWTVGTRQVVVATPTYAIFGTNNIGALIVEKESGNYRQIRAPHIDSREYFRTLAVLSGANLFFGDDFLSVEATGGDSKAEVLGSQSSGPRNELVDLKSLGSKTGAGMNILSPEFEK